MTSFYMSHYLHNIEPTLFLKYHITAQKILLFEASMGVLILRTCTKSTWVWWLPVIPALKGKLQWDASVRSKLTWSTPSSGKAFASIKSKATVEDTFQAFMCLYRQKNTQACQRNFHIVIENEVTESQLRTMLGRSAFEGKARQLPLQNCEDLEK